MNNIIPVLSSLVNVIIKSRCLEYDKNKCMSTKDGFYPYGSTQREAIYEAPCVFPFKYENKSYDSCTKLRFKRLWCATLVDETSMVMREWGWCKDSCFANTKAIETGMIIIDHGHEKIFYVFFS